MKSKLFGENKSFYRTVVGMMVPVALQNLITIAVNAIDMAMLRSLGEISISASSLASQYINIFQILCLGTGTGASVLASRYWGMREIPSIHKTITIMLRIILIIAAVFAWLSFFSPGIIIRMYTPDEAIIREGIKYLRFAATSFFFYGIAQTSTVILRSMRKVRLPLLITIGAFFLNIVGNYFLIYGKGGFPALGIAGASIATTIARVMECFFTFGYLIWIDRDIQYKIKYFFMRSRDLLPEYVRISLPVVVSDGMMALGNSVVMVVIGHMGGEYVAAYAVVVIVERLCTAWSSGVAHTSSVIIGNTLGEGRKEAAISQGWAFLGLGILLGMIAAAVVFLIQGPIISLYHLSDRTADIAGQLLMASVFIVIFQAVGSILTKGVLRGGGDTRALMIVDNIFLWMCSIPLGYLLGIILKCPAFWVYNALSIHHLIKSIWCVFRMRTDRWIHKIESL